MSDIGNVQLSALEDLQRALLSYKTKLQYKNSGVEILSKKIFSEFETHKRYLENELREVEEKLNEAENKLSKLQEEEKDSIVQECKVRELRDKRDEWQRKLNRCKYLIITCASKRVVCLTKHKIIQENIHKALKKLDVHIEDVNDFQRTSVERTSQYFTTDTNVEEPIKNIENYATFFFRDESGEPLKNVKITIVDNTPFGFGQEDVYTDENGQITSSNYETTDCSIYINGKEIYTGPLSKNMQFGIKS